MFEVWAIPLLFSWFWLIWPMLSTTSLATASMSKPGSPSWCGRVNIPYPFGIGLDGSCSLSPLYNIYCNTSFDPPKPFLPTAKGNLEIVNVSETGQLRIKSNNVVSTCYARGNVTSEAKTVDAIDLKSTPFVSNFDRCTYNFLGEHAKFSFKVADISDPTFMKRTQDDVLIVLEWVVGVNQTCHQAQKNASSYACHQNTACRNFNTSSSRGYRCSCLPGYKGNPYISPGCTDHHKSDPCIHPCIKRHHGDGLKNGRDSTSSTVLFAIKFTLGAGFGFLLLLIFISWILYFTIKRKKLMKMKEKIFEKNQGLLKQKLSPGSMESSKIFTEDELKEATNNYSDDRVLGQGGYGMVYKGILKDGCEVAIKKSKVVDQIQIEQFINEVVILTHTNNHQNVVKLIGYCLETEAPLLVYEFIANGTLFDHIHRRGAASWLNWENCVRLATEAAHGLAYLHSISIIHRDVKSTNLLLDNSFTAKICDFGTSRLVPIYQTQVTTQIQGTLGYLDPEYLHTSILTEKSDVYSFGVVLAEILTREKPVSLERGMKNRDLATYFVSAMEENCLFEIVDYQLVMEATEEHLDTMAEVVKKCLDVKGEDRPTMKEVVLKLEGLKKQMKDPGMSNTLMDDKLNHRPY